MLLLTSLALAFAPAQAAATPAQQFARCIAGADAAGSKALLALKPGSGESRKAADALATNAACSATLSGKKPSEAALRGAIAERLYLDAFATPPAELTGPPPPFTGSDDPNLAKYDMARCGATRDPVGADMLIRAGAGTPEEAAAIQRVVAAVGRCTLHAAFGKAELHALIAEGMWKIRGEAAPQ